MLDSSRKKAAPLCILGLCGLTSTLLFWFNVTLFCFYLASRELHPSYDECNESPVKNMD